VEEQCCAAAQWPKSVRFDLSYILAFFEAIWQSNGVGLALSAEKKLATLVVS